MKQNSKKDYVITSLALYFTYFIHGIGASILGHYKLRCGIRTEPAAVQLETGAERKENDRRVKKT